MDAKIAMHLVICGIRRAGGPDNNRYADQLENLEVIKEAEETIKEIRDI